MKSNEKDLFTGACGATGPLVFDILDDGETHRARRIFQQPYLLAGRGPDADLRLRHEQAAARQCYFQLIGGRLFGVDLGPRGGLRINGVSRRAGWVDRSQPLRIGPVGMVLQGGDGETSRTASDLDAPSPLSARYARAQRLPAATLEIASPGTEAHRWPMSRVLVLIGRSPACRLKLISPAIAEIHCALLRTAEGVWLIDLLAPGGVAVDGVPTRACRLHDGATLGLGPFTIRLRYEPASARRVRRRDAESGSGADAPPWLEPVADPAHGQTVLTASSSFFPPVPAVAEPPAAGSQEFRQVLRVAEVFESMHRDQMEMARQERNEIRRLADEIRALRADLRARHDHDHDHDIETGFDGVYRTGPAGRRNATTADPVAVGDGFGASDQAQAQGYARDLGRIVPRDPRTLHLIAREFLEDYRLRRHSLREKLIRMLVGGPSHAPE